MYRVHESPPLDKLEGLRESLAVLGYNLAKGAVIKPIMLTGILEQAAKDGNFGGEDGSEEFGSVEYEQTHKHFYKD